MAVLPDPRDRSEERAASPGSSLRPSPDWPLTWEAHSREQILCIARETTPAQRLAWLEAALELAHEAGALERSRDEEAERP